MADAGIVNVRHLVDDVAACIEVYTRHFGFTVGISSPQGSAGKAMTDRKDRAKEVGTASTSSSTTSTPRLRAHRGALQLLIDAVADCVAAGVFRRVDAAHVARVLWAAAHGAVSLELAGYEGAVDADSCFEDLLALRPRGSSHVEVIAEAERSVHMRIGVVEVSIDDQDKARAFYTRVVGFQVKDDASYSDTARWLTVVSSEDPDGPQVLLAGMSDAAAALQAARRETGAPAVSFTTEDCHRDYKDLAGRGAVFLSAPQQMGYGGTDAVFEDGCGNLLNLHQD